MTKSSAPVLLRELSVLLDRDPLVGWEVACCTSQKTTTLSAIQPHSHCSAICTPHEILDLPRLCWSDQQITLRYARVCWISSTLFDLSKKRLSFRPSERDLPNAARCHPSLTLKPYVLSHNFKSCGLWTLYSMIDIIYTLLSSLQIMLIYLI
jgi:hypothetical protein